MTACPLPRWKASASRKLPSITLTGSPTATAAVSMPIASSALVVDAAMLEESMEVAVIANGEGIASSMTGASTIAMPAITISTSSRSMPSGTVAFSAKGNSSSTVTLVNSGDASDHPRNSATISVGVPPMMKGTRCRMTKRCHPSR